MNSWINWAIQTSIMIGIGVIGFLLKKNQTSNEDRMKRFEEKLEENKNDSIKAISSLEQQLNDIKADMPFKYVLRDDFIRAMSNVDKKLDKIYDIVAKKGVE